MGGLINIKINKQQFKEIIEEFWSVIYPLILYFYCLFSFGPISIFFISRAYKDSDMINAIGIANLYINLTTEIIICALVGALETLASNAYGIKNFKLLGIYFDRCRIISFTYWIIISIFHYFFARNILGFLKVEEKVIDLTIEYISISVFSVFVNIFYYVNEKHLILIEKPKINFYISIGSLILEIISGYIFVFIFKLGVRGAALSFLIAAFFNSISSTYILKKMDLPEGSLIFFSEECLQDWKNYLDVAVPGILISGGEWIGYELQSIFAIYISSLDYSTQVILINLECLCFPFTGGINSAISMKSGEKLMQLKPENLKIYVLITYMLSFFISISVTILVIIFGDYYFSIISPNEEIYLNCTKVKYVVSYFVFVDNVYYFYLGCLKGFGYLRNTTIATFVMFYGIGPFFIYILSFKNKMGVKGIWESTSIALTLGDILFIYWVFSFDLKKLRELANERIEKDNKNLNLDTNIDLKTEFLNSIENNKDKEKNISKENNINNKISENNIEMNKIV